MATTDPLIHSCRPDRTGLSAVRYHLQLLPQGADGSLLAGHQLLQVLVPQLLPRSTLSGTLAASFQFCLQVNFGRFATAFSGFLYFPTNNLRRNLMIY